MTWRVCNFRNHKWFYFVKIGIAYKQSRLTITITRNDVRVSIDGARDFHILIDGKEQPPNETICMFIPPLAFINHSIWFWLYCILCCRYLQFFGWHTAIRIFFRWLCNFVDCECIRIYSIIFCAILFHFTRFFFYPIADVFNQYQILTLKPHANEILNACPLPADTIDPYIIPPSQPRSDDYYDEDDTLYWRKMFEKFNANNLE